jgi:hypothetical protein
MRKWWKTEALVEQLIQDELRASAKPQLHLPFPKEPELFKVGLYLTELEGLWLRT